MTVPRCGQRRASIVLHGSRRALYHLSRPHPEHAHARNALNSWGGGHNAGGSSTGCPPHSAGDNRSTASNPKAKPGEAAFLSTALTRSRCGPAAFPGAQFQAPAGMRPEQRSVAGPRAAVGRASTRRADAQHVEAMDRLVEHRLVAGHAGGCPPRSGIPPRAAPASIRRPTSNSATPVTAKIEQVSRLPARGPSGPAAPTPASGRPGRQMILRRTDVVLRRARPASGQRPIRSRRRPSVTRSRPRRFIEPHSSGPSVKGQFGSIGMPTIRFQSPAGWHH